MKQSANERGQWKSQWGFLIAAVGSAIGLGNIWRFSYMAYENGGGAFLIPYLVALLTTGIPLLLLEFAIGHEKIGSAPLTFAKINKKWEWVGWWSVTFVMFGIVLYYVVIIAWCLNFFLLSFDLGWGQDPDHFFFKEFLKLSKTPFNIGEIRTGILFATFIIWFINWLIVFRGVCKGIELANKIFMPLLFVLTTILVLWSLTLKGAGLGLKAYLTPDFSKLNNFKVWRDAYSQIFFTLSLGFGIMIAYASYLPEKANLTRNTLLTALINSGYSLFAGLATFSILGYMATNQGEPISKVVSQSIGLAFVTYPKALSIMPGGHIFGAIFFLCLVVAGLSSSISIIEAFTSAMVDKFNLKRQNIVTVLCFLGFIGSVIFTTQGGLFWLDIVDHFLTVYGLLAVGILECILVGWFFNLEMVRKHVNKISSIQIGKWWDILIKFIIPLILLYIFIWNLKNEITQPYAGYKWHELILIGTDWVLSTIIIAYFITTRPWKTEKHKEKGRASHSG